MASEKWYFNLSTGEVSQGKAGSWENRMGPYDSEVEAHKALEIARQRTEAADERDSEEDDWGDSTWKANR